jgi:hypothetical protein
MSTAEQSPAAPVRPDTAVAACLAVLERALAPEAALRATLELAAVAVGAWRGISRDEVLALGDALAPQGPGVLAAGTLSPALEREALAVLAPGVLREPGALGDVYEALLAARATGARKQRGSYFTPPPVARRLVARVLSDGVARGEGAVVLDPAMGAGRFLLEALAHVPVTALHGLDSDPVAVWVARLSVALASGETRGLAARLRVGDALAPGALAGLRAHAVLGNPPWLAHAGRQSVPLPPSVRQDYRARFRAFAGFPTTHGMFIELAANALAPEGRLGLLVPTQVADLAGYGPTRAALTAVARIEGPLEELGFGQFEGVTEPTVVLLARRDEGAVASDAPWPLAERDGRRSAAVLSTRTRGALARLADLPRFAPETFGEAGFQTAAALARTHLGDWPATEPRFTVPLREGRDVTPFRAGGPSRALDPDPAALARAGTRLRPPEAWARVAVVIRQTARYPIAAVHDPPYAFRNSLLAGYTDHPHALCALLNSTLLRALHLAAQRDGRQAVFPQLKIAHLRALPAPPPGRSLGQLEEFARTAAAAQQARWEAEQAFRARVGEGVPRGLFAPEGEGVPARPEMVVRVRARGDVGCAYDEALAAVRAAWGAYRRAVGAIDDAVFALYEVDGAARAELEAGLSA